MCKSKDLQEAMTSHCSCTECKLYQLQLRLKTSHINELQKKFGEYKASYAVVGNNGRFDLAIASRVRVKKGIVKVLASEIDPLSAKVTHSVLNYV